MQPEGFLGLWPEYALLNHSCMPNTTHVVVGGRLCLRAAHPILEGEEVGEGEARRELWEGALGEGGGRDADGGNVHLTGGRGTHDATDPCTPLARAHLCCTPLHPTHPH